MLVTYGNVRWRFHSRLYMQHHNAHIIPETKHTQTANRYMATGSAVWFALPVQMAVRFAIANNTRHFGQFIRRSGVHHGSTVWSAIIWQHGSLVWSAIPFGHAWETIFIMQPGNAGSHLWLLQG